MPSSSSLLVFSHTLTSAQSFIGVAASAPANSSAAIRASEATKLSNISLARLCARDMQVLLKGRAHRGQGDVDMRMIRHLCDRHRAPCQYASKIRTATEVWGPSVASEENWSQVEDTRYEAVIITIYSLIYLYIVIDVAVAMKCVLFSFGLTYYLESFSKQIGTK